MAKITKEELDRDYIPRTQAQLIFWNFIGTIFCLLLFIGLIVGMESKYNNPDCKFVAMLESETGKGTAYFLADNITRQEVNDLDFSTNPKIVVKAICTQSFFNNRQLTWLFIIAFGIATFVFFISALVKLYEGGVE